MNGRHAYPFSDLTAEELRQLTSKAKAEQAQAIRAFFGSLFRYRPVSKRGLIECGPAGSLGPCTG